MNSFDSCGSIGVISDTHGLVRPEIHHIFRDVKMIMHAGDIGGHHVLKTLETIAPVIAVRGNSDHGILAAFLNDTEQYEFEGYTMHMCHDLIRLEIEPAASGVHMVISGHTHQPDVRNDRGVLYLNPGSAGPKRSNKPITAAVLSFQNGSVRVRHFGLDSGIEIFQEMEIHRA